jgi:hypothetical protein
MRAIYVIELRPKGTRGRWTPDLTERFKLSRIAAQDVCNRLNADFSEIYDYRVREYQSRERLADLERRLQGTQAKEKTHAE